MTETYIQNLPLATESLYQRCDPEKLGFHSTEELTQSGFPICHDRAIEAISFALSTHNAGYNIYVAGAPGFGRHSLTKEQVEAQAKQSETPNDWCYVHNFSDPNKPISLQLKHGQGESFRQQMQQLIDDLQSSIRSAFESDEYRARRQIIEQSVMEKREQALTTLKEQAKEKNALLISMPTGFAFAPTNKGEVIKPDVFQQLPDELQASYEENIVQLQKELQETLAQFPIWEKEMRREIKALDNDVTLAAVKLLINELRSEYPEHHEILSHLDAVEKDVIETAPLFLVSEEERAANPMMPPPTFTRYSVNVLVTHPNNHGAPVIFVDHPTHASLVGRIEHRAQYGVLTTDLTLIRPGALHQASGGYLILDAAKVLTQPAAWETLKRSLLADEIRIEPIERTWGIGETVTLEPEPIPLATKVILIGDRRLYYLLSEYDPEFSELFKVMADLDDELDRSEQTHSTLAQLIANVIRKEKALPFNADAVARLIEENSRASGDAHKVSVNRDAIRDLVIEASFHASSQSQNPVQREDVEKAISSQWRRKSRIYEKLREQITDETIQIDTDTSQVGQINGLAVYSMGQFSFGKPSLITARVRPGAGGVLDIERKAELGGPTHTKGVMILSSYLAAQYGQKQPLSLSASLVFEQTYGGVDGDSASSTELYALLSALADLPVKQSLAVTGSINQFGQVQAIGGVNEKIEGFFDLCHHRGLTGEQGVLIPATNVRHLMLRKEVVEACAAGQFAIYPVAHVDQGIELLTGVKAGEIGKRGGYPKSSVNYRVNQRLTEFGKVLRQAKEEKEKAGG